MDTSIRPSRAPRLAWAEDRLEQSLQALQPGLRVELRAEVDSTNTQLLQRARDGAGPTPCLLVAEQQTAGRGRMGRAWASAPGRSLTFSLGLPLAPADWGGLSLALGVALAEALEPATDGAPRLLLKWPNDLWLRDAAAPAGGRKLGGVLIETVALGPRRWCVAGVGLNIGPPPLDPAPDPAPGAAIGRAGLHELDPAAAPPTVLARVAVPLLQALQRFEREGLAPYRPGFAARDILLGRELVVSGNPTLQGLADGIDADGALRVWCAGRCQRVSSGEASVRPQNPI